MSEKKDGVWREAPNGIEQWWLVVEGNRIIAKAGAIRMGGGAPYFAEHPLTCFMGQYLTLEAAQEACGPASDSVPPLATGSTELGM